MMLTSDLILFSQVNLELAVKRRDNLKAEYIIKLTWPSGQAKPQDLSTGLSPDGRYLVASAGGTYLEVVDIGSGAFLQSHYHAAFLTSDASFVRFNADGGHILFGQAQGPGHLPAVEVLAHEDGGILQKAVDPLTRTGPAARPPGDRS